MDCNTPPPQDFDITFTVCSSIDGGGEAGRKDAGEAGVDSGADAAVSDAGACFSSCVEACSVLPASLATQFSTGFCISSSDKGAGGVVSAHCKAELQCLGRKFEGLAAPDVLDEDAFRAWLARAAWLEAASVHAFRRLARELEAYDAPRALVLRAKACARDEGRHARMMTALAKKHGVCPPRVATPPLTVRDLESIARENAVEGCVGETYGALYAAWQAAHEPVGDVAVAMAAIAPDELRHAALGWAVAEWLDTRLTPEQRERVRRARADAARDIIASAQTPHERALARGLMRDLWAA